MRIFKNKPALNILFGQFLSTKALRAENFRFMNQTLLITLMFDDSSSVIWPHSQRSMEVELVDSPIYYASSS